MKRFLLIAALVLGLSCSAKAQLYLGGGLGAFVQDGKFSLNLSPEAGYNFNKYIMLGGRINFVTGTSVFGVTPFARVSPINIPHALSICLLANVPCYFGDNFWSVGAQIRPGLSVPVGQMVKLNCYIGSFGYTWLYNNGVRDEGWNATVTWDSITLGFSIEL